MAVTVAIRAQRLVKSVTRDEYGQPKITDFALADQEWEANTDAGKRPVIWSGELTAPDESVRSLPQTSDGEDLLLNEDSTMGDASRAEKIWKARQAELKYRHDAGELGEVAGFDRVIGDLVTSFRTRLLGLPSRLKSQDPTLTLAQLALIEALIREALEQRTEP